MKSKGANIKTVQKNNRSRVLNIIRNDGKTSRVAIGEQTGLSMGSVSNITAFLIRAGLVRECGFEETERTGRRSVLLEFDSSNYRLITISHFENTLNICLIDLGGNVLYRLEPPVSDPEKTIASMREGVQTLLRFPEAKNVLAVGVSMSAMVLDRGHRVLSSALKMDLMDVRGQLGDFGGLPVFISNDTFTKAMWLCRQTAGCEKGVTLYVEMDNGIGAALLQDGERLPIFVGEIGHTTVAPNAERCTCGRKGCLQLMCHPGRMLRLYSEKSGAQIPGLSELRMEYRRGNPAAREVLEECGGYLGVGLANLVSMFDPDTLLLNAPDYDLCPETMERACRVMSEQTLHGLGERMRVLNANFNRNQMQRAIAAELCDALFSEEMELNIWESIEQLAAEIS